MRTHRSSGEAKESGNVSNVTQNKNQRHSHSLSSCGRLIWPWRRTLPEAVTRYPRPTGSMARASGPRDVIKETVWGLQSHVTTNGRLLPKKSPPPGLPELSTVNVPRGNTTSTDKPQKGSNYTKEFNAEVSHTEQDVPWPYMDSHKRTSDPGGQA